MRSNLSFLVTQLRQADRPDTLVAQVWRAATSSADRDTQVVVAGLTNLPGDTADLVAGCTDPRVRATLLANPSFPDTKLTAVLAKERRAAVLADAIRNAKGARRTTLSDEARARLVAKPTVALAEALLSVDDLDDATTLTVARTLVARHQPLGTEGKENALLRLLGTLGATRAGELLALAPHWTHAAALCSAAPVLDDAAFANVMTFMVGAGDDAAKATNWSYGAQRIGRSVADALEKVLSHPATPAEWVNAVETIAVNAKNQDFAKELLKTVGNVRVKNGNSVSAAEVFGLLQRRAASGDVAALEAVFTHTDAAVNDRLVALTSLASRDPSRAVALVLGDDNWTVQLVEHSAHDLHKAGVLTALLGEDHAAAATALIAALIDRDAAKPAHRYSDRRQNIDVLLPYAGPSGARLLPWNMVLQATSWSYDKSDFLTKTLVAEQTARLTTDAHWDTYISLAANFSGTMADLFDAIDALVL